MKLKDSRADVNVNYLTLRRYLGILGISLPIILVMGNDFQLEPSISHFYYTDMIVVFTGILISFGLFLISYKGYKIKEGELFSDNLITNFAGILAFIVALVPTACAECDPGIPNGHNDGVRNFIHLLSAGLFITAMGFMSFVQFVKSDKSDPLTKRRKFIYRFCGLSIWAVVLFLFAEYVLDFKISQQDTFWGEFVALVFFGTAWLVKSESLENLGL